MGKTIKNIYIVASTLKSTEAELNLIFVTFANVHCTVLTERQES